MSFPIDILERAQAAREHGWFAKLDPSDANAEGFVRPGAILARGKDAARFLHGQVTNEVEALEPGEGNFSARVTLQGQLLHFFSLHRLPSDVGSGDPDEAEVQTFLLLVERDQVEALISAFDAYLFSDDVNFRDVSEDYAWSTLQGVSADAVLQSANIEVGESPLRPYACRVLESPGDGSLHTLLISRSLAGDPGFLLATPNSANDALHAQLETAARDADFETLAADTRSQVAEILRIEAGQVRVGVDTRDRKSILPETGLEQQAVSYTKGCYLGQEVIARVRTYGALPYGLRGLVFDSAPQGDWSSQARMLERLPDIGGGLRVPGEKKAVGQIVSRTISPVLGYPVAYAYLDKGHRTPGQTLDLELEGGNVTARVTLLPFYSAPDRDERVAFLYDRAVRVFAQGREEEALGILEEALGLDPGFSDGYEAVGVILGRSERFHEAIDIFKRLEELAPTEPMVNTNLSLYYMKIGDKTTAENHAAKAMQKSLALGTGNELADDEIDAQLREQERTDATRKQKMFGQVLEIDPDDPVALFGMGNALATLEHFDEAESHYARAAAADANNSAVYLAHGKTLEELGRPNDAERVYRAGMEVASRKGDLMPLKEMEHRALLLSATRSDTTRETAPPGSPNRDDRSPEGEGT
ncbi:MAG: glycine cleavage T C-terminal barrel domain-containing protein [Myxococcota bacterium]|nr:glycine cleavage T C-terminal barrel domain-containing protein [Myxococcota bacterium]